eukprot:RCo045456
MSLEGFTLLFSRCFAAVTQQRVPCRPRERHTFIHHPLAPPPRIVGQRNLHNPSVVGLQGWPSGWLTFPTSDTHIDLDCGQPVLLTKLSIYAANRTASPREMELLSSEDGESYLHAYAFRMTNRNFRGTKVAAGTPYAMDTESWYFMGAHNNDANSAFPLQDHYAFHLRGCVHSGLGKHATARFWRFSIKSGNGSHYVGINRFHLHGVPASQLL